MTMKLLLADSYNAAPLHRAWGGGLNAWGEKILPVGRWGSGGPGFRSFFHRNPLRVSAGVKRVITVALVGFVACADLLTGEEITLSIFYLVPVAFATGVLNARAGFVAAIIVGVVWLVVDLTQSGAHSRPWLAVGNAVVRLAFLVWMVGFLSRLNTVERSARE